jgi:uncharacterized protein YbdZ (MbtH family)
MANPFESEGMDYLVLANLEEMYSIWPAVREIPEGWTAVGPKGERQFCLDWIDSHWTDMRPKSLKNRSE